MKKSTLLSTNVSTLSENERFNILKSFKINANVLKYLKNRLQNLTINMYGDYIGNVMELMSKGLLEGWCWETTESSVVFFEDDDYIERGTLTFTHSKQYWHSWICFKHKNTEFVFDPCLRILAESSIYHHVFEITVEGKVSAQMVREDLFYQANHYQRPKSTCEFLEKFFAEHMSEQQKKEVVISGNDDVTTPMYRNNTGYILEKDNEKLKSLYAHFYLRG